MCYENMNEEEINDEYKKYERFQGSYIIYKSVKYVFGPWTFNENRN